MQPSEIRQTERATEYRQNDTHRAFTRGNLGAPAENKGAVPRHAAISLDT